MAYVVRHPFTDFFNLTRATFDEGGKRLNERAGRVIARRIAVLRPLMVLPLEVVTDAAFDNLPIKLQDTHPDKKRKQ